MAFTTTVFLFIFFPLCLAGYYIIKLLDKRNKKLADIFSSIYLILVSIAFYAYGGLNGAILFIFYILFVWISGKIIEKYGRKRGKSSLILSIFAIILTAILVYYKYYNFIAGNLNNWFNIGLGLVNIIVPLGISFITFSAISYIMDIYRGNATAGSILDAALYLSFFPKVISGPIELWKDFQGQIKERHIDESCFLEGLNRIMIGFAKKLILADNFGAMVSKIQGINGIDQPTAWVSAFFYMMQIYYDFAGYSDIAIGISKLLGFNLKENFNFPYVSKSITEFWRRWHISLGTWFREYIYIPLGGNRKGKARTLINLFIVFLLTGIWHGSAWNYICWGILNGICILIERCIMDKTFYKKIPSFIKWAFTMFIVLISWQVFLFTDMSELFYNLKLMFGMESTGTVLYSYRYFMDTRMIVLSVIAVLGAAVLHFPVFKRFADWTNSTKTGLIVKETGLILLMIISVICMINSSYSPFLYFQY